MGIDFVEEPDKWIKEWKHQVNTNTNYHEVGADWGVSFNGNYVFEVQPDSFIDTEILHFSEVSEGEVHSARAITREELENSDELEYGFRYKGPYANWKKLIRGEVGPVDGLMSGEFDLDGDMQKVLQYNDAAATLASAASQVDTDFPA